MPGDVGHEAGRRTYVGGILGHDVARDEEPVATEPGVDRHILLAIGPPERDRVPDDPRSHLELREHLPGTRVNRLEPTIERTVKCYPSRGHQGSTPDRVRFLDLPHLLAAGGIEGDERPHVAALTGIVG